MSKSFIRPRVSANRLRRVAIDQSGVVSFEYVIAAACIVTALLTAFGTDVSTDIGKALSDEIARIVAQLP